MMHERVIWSRRYLTNGVRSANVSLVPLRGHLSESVPAVYRAVDTPPEMHKTTAINTQTKERK